VREGRVVFDVNGRWSAEGGKVKLGGSVSLYDCFFWGENCDGVVTDEEMTIAFCGGVLRYWKDDFDFALSRAR
jgi:hypothetical protein